MEGIVATDRISCHVHAILSGAVGQLEDGEVVLGGWETREH